MIDPGHGGKDTGAVRGPLKESDITLKVSLKLAALLKADARFKVGLTRSKDETLTLNRRTRISNDAKSDLFISIHLNSSSDPRAQGKEFYFQNQLPVDEDSMFLASRENADSDSTTAATQHESQTEERTHDRLTPQTDLRRIIEDLERNERIFSSNELAQLLYKSWIDADKGHQSGSRAIRQAPFYVVSNVMAPSVLIELGFLTHQQEGPKLNSSVYQNELAQSIYRGLIKYKENMDKDH
jgi:N-acetylmuramoyl-L-alanine amidase